MMLNVHSSHTISHIPAALSSNVEMHACVDRNQRETRRIVRKGKERFFFVRYLIHCKRFHGRLFSSCGFKYMFGILTDLESRVLV